MPNMAVKKNRHGAPNYFSASSRCGTKAENAASVRSIANAAATRMIVNISILPYDAALVPRV
jgi:hypothetical protein